MADFDVHYDPITINTDAVTVDIKGLDNAHLTLATPQPLAVNTKSDFNVNTKNDFNVQENLESHLKSESTLSSVSKLSTDSKIALEPIVTQSTAQLDLKPLALDQCLRISFGPLPPTCVRQPYQQHFGFTLFGMEIFGFNLAGESQVMVTGIPPKPQIAGGGEHAVRQYPHPDTHMHNAQPARHGGEGNGGNGGINNVSSGLKIRLDR